MGPKNLLTKLVIIVPQVMRIEEARATEWMVWHILKLETKKMFCIFLNCITVVLDCTVTLPPLKDHNPA